MTTTFTISEPAMKYSEARKAFELLGPDRRAYASTSPGQYGGYRPRKVYGRLNCPAALRAIARGGYMRDRVFFADEATAIAAGYRPCAVCLPKEYRTWKRRQKSVELEWTASPGGLTRGPFSADDRGRSRPAAGRDGSRAGA